jgi:hypothetical protein
MASASLTFGNIQTGARLLFILLFRASVWLWVSRQSDAVASAAGASKTAITARKNGMGRIRKKTGVFVRATRESIINNISYHAAAPSRGGA